ncbi:hypothetical protein BN137_3517 [Cronobacter condimenti 1330]|uniref:Uncharacterized protein n=1 Tax=Cronobacter condimenti 1330 TaxID=1073999 RepID=K8AEC6_9ENTR|nr:hypothetical protein [Cronobacter condimenti]ALB64086.1 hypothetical protein AFK62_16950 [Cronobacter condimenti 1330]CCJ74124.1 hypothetical protein BN137_3517 [Cronobacter condimenti 1330]
MKVQGAEETQIPKKQLTADYRRVQTTVSHLRLMADCDLPRLEQCRNVLAQLLVRQGIDTHV